MWQILKTKRLAISPHGSVLFTTQIYEMGTFLGRNLIPNLFIIAYNFVYYSLVIVSVHICQYVHIMPWRVALWLDPTYNRFPFSPKATRGIMTHWWKETGVPIIATLLHIGVLYAYAWINYHIFLITRRHNKETYK